MSLDTKGIVVTENKDVRDIAIRVLNAIKDVPCEPNFKGGFSNPNYSPILEYRPKENFFLIHFKDGDLKRMLWVFLECDSDYPDFGEKNIIMSFGCFGNSVGIMNRVLQEFKDLGKCYIQENDCDGIIKEIE